MIKRLFLLTVFLSCTVLSSMAQVLGNYLPLTLGVGRDTSVNPSGAPSNTSKISVFASGNFSGILTANSSNGKLKITDPKPAGNYTVTVMAFSPTGTTSIKTFNLIVKNTECSDGRFNGNSNFALLRPNLTGLAIGDFNEDGIQDLLAAHLGYNSVSIRLGNGSGSFTGNTEEPVSSHPNSLAVGDFDRDGKQDFIVSNEGADLVAVRLGDGTGAFNSMPNVPVGNAPAVVALGDFNNDGKLDFAVANFHGNTVSIRLGDGSGNFSGNTNIPVGDYPQCVAVGDFNNDGKHDFAVSNTGSHTVSIRLGNGSGGFIAMPDIAVGFNPYGIALGDFNTDGNLDIASANFSSNNVSIHFGNGAGGFTGNTIVSVGSGPYGIIAGNFNGDDHLDLAVTNYLSNTVSVRLGDGLGHFSGNTQIPAGSYPINVVAGEFNGDKRQDLAIANYNDHSISIRLGMNGIPSINPVASNSPVCAGQKIELYASGASAYSWSGPNSFSSALQNPEIPSASSSNAGIYSLSVIDYNNCSATLSTIVRINPPPVVTCNLLQDSLCSFDAPIILGGGLPVGGTYSGPGVVGGHQFDPAVSGVGNFYINYTYTDSNDCSNSNFDKMDVIICNDVIEYTSLQQSFIYPNPARDYFYISDEKIVDKNSNVQLFSVEGQLIREWRFSSRDNIGLFIGDLNPGIYFIQMNNENYSLTARLFRTY